MYTGGPLVARTTWYVIQTYCHKALKYPDVWWHYKKPVKYESDSPIEASVPISRLRELIKIDKFMFVHYIHSFKMKLIKVSFFRKIYSFIFVIFFPIVV